MSIEINHFTSPSFGKAFELLPPPIQDVARKQHKLLESDPNHPSLQFKWISDDVWSARVSEDYRALGKRFDDKSPPEIWWYWIGPHATYNELIKPKHTKKTVRR